MMTLLGFGVTRHVTDTTITIENSVNGQSWTILLAEISNPALKYTTGGVYKVWQAWHSSNSYLLERI